MELWSPAKVAQNASERTGRKIADATVRNAILRGDIPALPVHGTGSRKIAFWAVKKEDAEKWEPCLPGRPRHGS